MTFNPVDHPRATDGTFAEKVGASPEIALKREVWDKLAESLAGHDDGRVEEAHGEAYQKNNERGVGLPAPGGKGASIIYTDLDVLQYAKDYYDEDWETSEDRETILAERRDEYLTYRQTTDGLEEAARHFASGPHSYGYEGEPDEIPLYDDLPQTVYDNAIEAAQDVAADDIEGVASVIALSRAAHEAENPDFGNALADIVSSKLLTNVLKLPRDDQGRPVYDTEAVARREKYHRAARNSLEVLSSGARIPADLDHWERVYWAAEEERTPAELAKVLLSESEGEFARVILDHKKVTPEMVTYAARSNDGAVQHAVINHPKATAAALQEVQARVERDYQEAIDPNNAWGTMKPYYDRQAEQAVSFMKDISDARGRLGAEGAW